MGLFDFLKNIVDDAFNETGNDYLNFQDSKKCMIKVKLKESEMVIWALQYIDGATSYRLFYREVFKNNINRFKEEITQKIENKAKSGCYYDNVYMRFYTQSGLYIDIPLNVFSQKKSIEKEELIKKLWHKRNLERLEKNNEYYKEKIQKVY